MSQQATARGLDSSPVSRSSRGGQTGAGSSGSLGAAISEDLSGNHASRARESCARPSENGASENQKLLNGQDPFDRGEDVGKMLYSRGLVFRVDVSHMAPNIRSSVGTHLSMCEGLVHAREPCI